VFALTLLLAVITITVPYC